MQDKLTARLNELRQEYEAGEKRLQVVDSEALRLRETMLRISGAIQVLQELIDSPEPAAASSPNGTDAEHRLESAVVKS